MHSVLEVLKSILAEEINYQLEFNHNLLALEHRSERLDKQPLPLEQEKKLVRSLLAMRYYSSREAA